METTRLWIWQTFFLRGKHIIVLCSFSISHRYSLIIITLMLLLLYFVSFSTFVNPELGRIEKTPNTPLPCSPGDKVSGWCGHGKLQSRCSGLHLSCRTHATYSLVARRKSATSYYINRFSSPFGHRRWCQYWGPSSWRRWNAVYHSFQHSQHKPEFQQHECK